MAVNVPADREKRTVPAEGIPAEGNGDEAGIKLGRGGFLLTLTDISVGKLQSSVDFSAVANIMNYDGVAGKVKLIDDALITNSAAPGSFGSGKFTIRRNRWLFG